jgi:[ribosomal protein S5]-alanine N-acetyltransferase
VSFIVETERLRLRFWMRGDAGAIFALASDPEVMRHVGDGRPWACVERAREWLGWMADCYRQHGYGRWAVVEREGTRVVGSCGFWPLAETGEVDFGYLFARDCWGRGYATESARAALDHGFGPLGFDRVVARTTPDNAASRRVLEKLGFEYGGLRTYGDEGGAVLASYALRRADFGARRSRVKT